MAHRLLRRIEMCGVVVVSIGVVDVRGGGQNQRGHHAGEGRNGAAEDAGGREQRVWVFLGGEAVGGDVCGEEEAG